MRIGHTGFKILKVPHSFSYHDTVHFHKLEDVCHMWWRLLLELQICLLSMCWEVWNTAGCTASISCAACRCSRLSSFRINVSVLINSPVVATGLFNLVRYSAMMMIPWWQLHSSAESGSCNMGNEHKCGCPDSWDEVTNAAFSPLQLVFPCFLKSLWD